MGTKVLVLFETISLFRDLSVSLQSYLSTNVTELSGNGRYDAAGRFKKSIFKSIYWEDNIYLIKIYRYLRLSN